MDDKFSLYELRYSLLLPTQTGLEEFKCSNKEFENYLQVTAHVDADEKIGQTWLFRHSKKIAGYITISMNSIDRQLHEDLQLDREIDMPALLIGHLATHKDYEGQGIGSHMVSWAIKMARNFSKKIGCRFVVLNAEKNSVDFYKKLNFVHVENDESNIMFIDLKKYRDNDML